MKPSDEETQGPVIRDRRRIDPQTGQVRDVPGQPRPGRHSASKPSGPNGPAGTSGQDPAGPEATTPAPASTGSASTGPGGTGPGGGATGDAAARLAERTADLQRLQAEYANYRKRVERDRM